MTIQPYNRRSKSFKKLLVRGIQNLATNINWGNPKTKFYNGLNVNSGNATNKLLALQIFEEHNIPTLEWTTEKEVAQEHTPVYCRTVLTGSKGKGIIIANTPEEVITAPLYTKALKDYEEYRIHVMNSKVFYAQKKLPREDVSRTDIKTGKDYYFSKRDINRLHQQLYTIPINTINALQLDFGAVDVMKKGNDIRVLEVNTAPGLDNSTANAYAQAFKENYQ